jgi:hypothetical protein
MVKYRLILDAIIPHSQSNGNAWFDRPFDSAQDKLTTSDSAGGHATIFLSNSPPLITKTM